MFASASVDGIADRAKMAISIVELGTTEPFLRSPKAVSLGIRIAYYGALGLFEADLTVMGGVVEEILSLHGL